MSMYNQEKNTMEINYYRQNSAQGYDESWKSCQFTSITDPSSKYSKDSPLCHGSAVSTSKLPHDVNNSLTLPTHPQSVVACPMGSGTAAVIPSGNQPCQAHDNPYHDIAFFK